ncbi:MAG TPA: hypothetical protein VKT32_12780 [Chthonomonadaceae bacterium]|nr:hypothetical protein [Chthonomonadaceae bacterium]
MALPKWLRLVPLLCAGILLLGLIGCGSKDEEPKDLKNGGDYYTGKDFKRPGSNGTQSIQNTQRPHGGAN